MGFFNIATTTADGTPFGYKASKQLVDAIGLACGKDRTRPMLGAIQVDLDKGELTATNAHVLLRATLGPEPLKDYVLPALEYMAHGQPCPVDSGVAYWMSDASAKACNGKAGWQDGEFIYPAVDKVIPTKFKHTHESTHAMRPFFAFDVLDVIARAYKLLGIDAKGFYNFDFNEVVNAAVEKWQGENVRVVAGGVCLSPDVTILAMPVVPDFMR